VFWAYHGWMTIGPVAEEVVRPQRNLPLALIGGMGIVTALYLGANLAYSLVIPRPEMAALQNTTVAAEFGRRLLGPLGAVAASAAVMVSVFGALNGLLLAGPRLLYAMGEDNLVPRSLAEIHPRYRTPALAILAMGGWAALQVVAVALLTRWGWLEEGKSHFDVLTDFAMFGALTFETMAVLAIFVFRRRLPAADRPYRCPGYPVVPALYVLLPGFVLTNMFVSQPREAGAALGFIALGAMVYGILGLGYRKPGAQGASAL
jgi:amino acid transporter